MSQSRCPNGTIPKSSISSESSKPSISKNNSRNGPYCHKGVQTSISSVSSDSTNFMGLGNKSLNNVQNPNKTTSQIEKVKDLNEPSKSKINKSIYLKNPRNDSTPEKENKVYEITYNPSKVSLPCVRLRTSISREPLTFLVDTGSSICLVKKSSIQTPHLKLKKDNILKLKGIDNDKEAVPTLGDFNMNLILGKESIPYNFHVVDKINLPYDGIIGNNLMTHYQCNIDYNRKILNVDKNKLKLIFNDPVYHIPPRSEMLVECSVRNPEIKEGLILDEHLTDSLLIANCVVKVKENNRVNLTLLNSSDKSIDLNSNLQLTLHPIEKHTYHFNTQNKSTCLNRTKEVLNCLRTSHLNSEESRVLRDVCSKYSDVFHLPNEQLTSTEAITHQIRTTSEQPINVKSYRFPEIHKQEVQAQIDKMLDQNIIQPSLSPWSSPIWIVPKKLDASGQKKWRIVIDYRKLNDITIGETYPIPNITEILDQLGKSKYFSTLDLASGFHQIKMNPQDSCKTAFSVPQGHFEFCRMPFGLKNAPSTFQRLMNNVLTGLQGERCFVYLDDVVIYSHDLNSHIENLSAVFQKLRSFNLKLQPDKCEFLRKEVGYLGHVITEDGLKPDPNKIKSVQEFPVPKCPKDIKSFLGLISYYRRFIPDFSKLSKPLTSLLKKDIPFIWSNEQQLSFESLKDKLISAPVLTYPDFTKPFTLTCDASNYAISAILSQGPIGKDNPIAYSSRTLNKNEINYSTTEKELLAIIFGCKNFRPYLFGRKFLIVTDHRPLKWLFNHSDPSSKMQRWRLQLEEFEYEIIYRKGKLNSAADALSRYPVLPISNEKPEKLTNSSSANDVPPAPENPNNENTLLSPFSPLTLDDLGIPIPDIDQINLDDLSITDLLEDSNALPSKFASPPKSLKSTDVQPPTLHNTPTPSISIPENKNKNKPNSYLQKQNPVDPQPSTSRSNPEQNLNPPPKTIPETNDNYSKFLKSNASYNTPIIEHNDHLLKTQNKIIVVPSSLDLDESIPYVQDILSNASESQSFIQSERKLHSYKSLSYNDKTYYFLFTKVHHFDDCSYSDIFETLKTFRNHLLSNLNQEQKISITDFKNPFDRHIYSKLYNILAYLFNNTGVEIHIYRNKIYYPSPSEVKRILKENHDIPIAGHLGSNRMFNKIREQFYWKNMRSDIENYVKECISCQTNKALRKINRAPMQITSTSTVPFERISLDIVGPLPESGTAKLKYILTIQDDLTKYSAAYPIRTTTAEETSDCLIHFISQFGIPKTILTDQGTNFTAELFKETCSFLKIKQLWSSPYHPQTQGALERSHSTLKEYLKSYVDESQSNWPRYVYTAMLAYNTAIHSTTNYSPYELLFGHQPYLPNSIYEPSSSNATYSDYVQMLKHRFQYSRSKALENINKSKISSKTYYDSHSKPINYKVGDYVYLKNHLRLRKALSPIWKGPYKVVKINGRNSLTLLINRRHVTHHFDQVKLARRSGD